MVFLPLSQREQLVHHCLQSYPKEGCGLLVGTRSKTRWRIVRCHPVPNSKEESAQRYEFEIDPKDYLRIDKEASQEGLQILGIFHSHPDVPPYPSAADARLAWTNTLNLIVAIYEGRQVKARVHFFDGASFHELPLLTILDNDLTVDLPDPFVPDQVLNLTGEVEPFLTIGVKECVPHLPDGAVLLVRFDFEPAKKTLPSYFAQQGHQVRKVWWNEEGFYEVVVRVVRPPQT
ncbi:MAG: M67 family metallopeptidase [Armatimonadota bacterium]|nr:M67 family metallopeptidase [Armatimonadota bacterium]